MGIDDAGRGPVIGPLIIVGVVVKGDKVNMLRSLGVKDSKLLSPTRRARLFMYIKQICEKIIIKEISPTEIDKAVFRITFSSLNQLEAYYMAEIIKEGRPNVVYIDSPDVVPSRFKQIILSYLPEDLRNITIVAENKADKKYAIVSAASIIAKEIREMRIKELKRKYGDFGSGYPSDLRTIEFLRRYYKTNKCFPPIVRESWSTLKKILQKQLFEDF